MSPTSTAPLKPATKKIWLFGLLGLVALLVVGAAIANWVIMPRMAEKMIRAQLDRLESRVGLELETGSIQTAGWDGVVIDSFKASLPGEEAPFLTIGELRVSVALRSVLAGERAIGGLTVEDVELRVHRHADGTLNLDTLRKGLRREGSDDKQQDPDSSSSSDDGPSWLRHFGGSFPNLAVHGAVLRFTSDKEDEPWPLSAMRTDEAVLNGSRRSGQLTSKVSIDAVRALPGALQIPETLDIALNLALPLTASTGRLDFSPKLEVAHVGPFPFFSASLTSIAIEEGPQIGLEDLSLALTTASTTVPIASAGAFVMRLADVPRDLESLRVIEVELNAPVGHLRYNEDGANTVDTLRALIAPSAPGQVIATARATAAAIAELAPPKQPGDAGPAPGDDTIVEARPGLRERLKGLNWTEIVTRHAPHRLDVREGRLIVRDDRPHPTLLRSTPAFSVDAITLAVVHRPLKGELTLDSSWKAVDAEQSSRGAGNLSLNTNYRTGKLGIDTTADAVDLGLVAQLAGRRATTRLYGGILRARLEYERPTREGQADFSGLLSLSDTTLFLAPIAEDPIERLNGSYQIEGYYHPKAPIPAARLIKGDKVSADSEIIAVDAAPVEVDPGMPPTRGALVITTGTARLGQVAASVKPALYGLDGMRRMPARFDLQVALDQTNLSDIVDAIPAALKGPLDGIAMKGRIQWDFDLEVPLYEASQMQWNADVKLDGFEVSHLPAAVNVFKLTDEFDHTIHDRFHPYRFGQGEPIDFERTVRIPAMKPTPATWLLENTSLSLQQIDRQRRRRGWPPVPTPHGPHGLGLEVINSADYWLTDHALSQAAPKPWKDDVPQAASRNITWPFTGEEGAPEPRAVPLMGHRDDPDRYGKYQFVPLHHVSPWMPRAIMTTEDNSFFTHSGFNWLAIKQSVQSNLRARSYVRGASTISMQLAKNLYLDRSKVLSRKLQEVAIVWLMESVADIPKERLMEIYLNIIEFGPGIFGIHDASVHYFGKRPDKLDISEVAWLVSIVPSPKRHHVYYERGEINDVWHRRMNRYIRVMYNRERITEEEYQQAIQIRPTFYKPAEGEPLFRVQEPTITVEVTPDVEDDDEDDDAPRGWPGFRDFFQ